MKIKEILTAGKPSVSFEVFPPKADASFEPIRAAVARLDNLQKSFYVYPGHSYCRLAKPSA